MRGADVNGGGDEGDGVRSSLNGSIVEASSASRGTTSNMSKRLHADRIWRRSRRRRTECPNTSTVALLLLASSLPASMAQGCISLEGSTACPAFDSSSVSTDAANIGFFPFLADVTDTDSFDTGLRSYITDGFAEIKYVFLNLGLSRRLANVKLGTNNYWAAPTSTPTTRPISTRDTRLQCSVIISCRVR